VSRATFFRHYRSKDDVIFPDHDSLLGQVGDRLRSSNQSTALAAVSDAVRLVLLHYLEEGEVARRRYALTSSVPALRHREIVSGARYQRLFREFIAEWMADRGRSATQQAVPLQAAPLQTALQAELMAASVVSAHNHVLRRWLRGESPDPVREVDEAMRQVIALFAPRTRDGGTSGTTVVAFRTDDPIEDLLPAIAQVLGGTPPDVAG
jgi:AcrR family transcriptional regulator